MSNDQNTLADYKVLLSCLSDGELSALETQELLIALEDSGDLKAELRSYWSRLQLMNQIMHGQAEHLISNALEVSNNVLLAIDSERTGGDSLSDVLDFKNAKANAVNSGVGSQPRHKEAVSALTGFAIAASVMFVVTFGWLGSQASVQQSVLALFSPQGQALQEEVSQLAVNNPAQNSVANPLAKPLGRPLGTIDTRFQSKDSILVGLNSAPLAASTNTQKLNELYLSEHRIEDYMLLHAEHASLNTNQGMMPFARISKVTKSNQF